MTVIPVNTFRRGRGGEMDLVSAPGIRDIVGLYLDSPEKALVLCVDEKSQIQALDRSAPVLPMMPGLPERRTHDYLRHFYGSIHRRHRAAEFKKFLITLDGQIPAGLDVHLICDKALEKDIRNWIATWNENPKPFTWTKTADEILENLASFLQRIPGAGH
jgi:hypothetical protein